jgi:metal-responsive CopG/Arc/MetJ family transcriptional regulator
MPGEEPSMHHPNELEFLQALLETMDNLPPDFVQRFEEILKKKDADRSQAIRQLFEDFAGE